MSEPGMQSPSVAQTLIELEGSWTSVKKLRELVAERDVLGFAKFRQSIDSRYRNTPPETIITEALEELVDAIAYLSTLTGWETEHARRQLIAIALDLIRYREFDLKEKE